MCTLISAIHEMHMKINRYLKHLSLMIFLFASPVLLYGQGGTAVHDLSGMLMLDSVPAHSYQNYLCDIKLFEFVDSTDTYRFHSSTVINPSTGQYTFANLPDGKYLVHASTSNSFDYFPTYYPDHAVWRNAQPVTLIGSSNFNSDINMSSVDYIGYDGAAIGGNVSDITDSSNVGNVYIYLMDTLDNILLFTSTDSLGNYHFDDLNFGHYWIHADILNKPCDDIKVILSASQNVQNVNFLIDDDGVTSNFLANLDENLSHVQTVYPNPFNEEININFKKFESGLLSLELYNILGQRVTNEIIEINGRSVSIKIDGQLPKGLYKVIIKINDQVDSTIQIMH